MLKSDSDILSILEVSAEDDAEPLIAYDHVIQLDPNDAYVYINKEAALQKLEHYEEATTTLDHVIQLDPNDAASY